VEKGIDLLLINPGGKKEVYGDLRLSFSAIEPPVWAGLIAAFVCEKGFSVKIIDAEVENYSDEQVVDKIVEYSPTLIAIGAVGSNPSASSSPKMVPAGKLLKTIKNRLPHINTSLYEIHPSALPEKTLNEEKVDFIFRGECFYTVVKLLEELKSNRKTRDYNINGLWYNCTV